MALLQNLYILNVHCLVGSVLLPRKEVLGDRIQDVGAEDLRQRSTITDRQSVQSEQLCFWEIPCPGKPPLSPGLSISQLECSC